jgi:hypothetical protein
MHQQAEIDNRQLVPKGRIVQHEVQLLSSKWRQDLRQKELPDQRHHNALIRDEACQAPLNTRHLRLAETAFV